MTNPNNAIGTNAAYSGRTSPNAFNDITASFTAGIVSGWECVPKTGMTVKLGGVAGTRDVALAEDNAGNKLTINNRSGAPVEVTLSGAPSTNNRVDAIVAYIDNPSTGDDNTTDNPTTCGIIAVSGTVAANPSAPTEATIRAAITTDGATGGSAYYVILATIMVGTNVTTIGSGVITQGEGATTDKIPAITTGMIADDAITAAKISGGTSADTLANGALVEVVGTTTGDCNYALKYADGRLICFQKLPITDKSVTQAWGSDFIGIINPESFSDYAVEFTAEPIISVVFAAQNENKNTAWAVNTGGTTTARMGQCYLVRPNGATVNGTINVVAYGFWK